MTFLAWVGAIVVAYLLGALPFGYLIAMASRKIDITRIGSGHTGGSNVLRAAGVLPGLLTVIFDYAKGYMAVWIASLLVPGEPSALALAGIAVVAGHNWPVFLRFDGGVGTMTTAGAATVLSGPLTAGSVAVSVIVLLVFRYSSVASLLFAVLLVLGFGIGAVAGWWHWSTLLFAVVVGSMSAYRLKANIERLTQGTERKLGEFLPHAETDED